MVAEVESVGIRGKWKAALRRRAKNMISGRGLRGVRGAGVVQASVASSVPESTNSGFWTMRFPKWDIDGILGAIYT